MVSMASRTTLVWLTVIENAMLWRRQAAMTLAEWNPESARNVNAPVAPARRTRPASAFTNMQDLAGVSAGGHQRVQPQHPGVTVCRALLGIPVNLAHRRVHIDRHR